MSRTILPSPSACCISATSSAACQNTLNAAPPHNILRTITHDTIPLFTRAKLLTRFLLTSAPLPPFLQRHGAFLLFTTGAAIGSSLYAFFQKHKQSAGKIQLAVFHIIRTVEGLPDLEERLQKPRELIAAIEREVLDLVELHGQISPREGDVVARELKRKVWRVVDERVRGEREGKKRRRMEREGERENSEEEEDEDKDIEMRDTEDEMPTPPTFPPKQDISTPIPAPALSSFGLDYNDPTLYSPPSPPSTTPKSNTKPKPMLESATRRAFGLSPIPPITKNKLTRGRGPGTALSPLPGGVSPQQSPEEGVVRYRYRVAESRRLWRELQERREREKERKRNVGGNDDGDGNVGERVKVKVEEKRQEQETEKETEKEMKEEEEVIHIITTPSPPKKKRGRPWKDLGKERMNTSVPVRRSSSRSSAYKGGYRG